MFASNITPMIWVVGVLFLSMQFGQTFGHVSWTYPAAREFSLDFLNTFWTKQPCGMPKGRAKTSLLAGTSFNATWHLGYAHGGGYRIELLDRHENKILDLTKNEVNGFYLGRMTAQWHLVDLPRNLTCHDCTMRLLRQVPEFSPDFQFLSCADVDIVDRHNFVETCSGHGYFSGGKCNCYSSYFGSVCQFQNECESDSECGGNNGKCIDLGGTALPRKQCFCSPTHFGTNCNRRNPTSIPTSLSNLDLSKHVRVKLSDKMTLLFKIILGTTSLYDEIEFVVQMNGTSFAGIGWRPSDLGPICKSWPFYPDALLPNLQTRRFKRSSTFTITKSVDQAEIHDDNPAILSTYQSDDEIFYRTIPKSSSRIVSNKLASPASDFRHAAEENRFVQTHASINNTPRQQFRQIVQQQTTRRPRISTTTTTTAPRHHTVGEQQASFVPSEWAATDSFSSMDCADIVIGAAKGNFHRIRDAYARGRHTPKVDSEWGGRDDLTGASGFEKNGVTTLIFRRRLSSSDGPDHPINGEMLLIWAKGQEPNTYVAEQSHRLEKNNPYVSDFYTLDEYKYHGLASQRGSIYVDFSAVRKEYARGAFN